MIREKSPVANNDAERHLCPGSLSHDSSFKFFAKLPATQISLYFLLTVPLLK